VSLKHRSSSPADSSFTLAVKVVPGAPANRFAGYQGDELVVKIAAQPEKGKANKELIAFFAKSLGAAKSDVVLVRGETSHHKLLRLPEACRAELKKLIS
jgi:uncharacterized protein (TIGR00251 family)